MSNAPIWTSPQQMLDDFWRFVEEQKPKRETVLKNVAKGKGKYSIEEVEIVSKQGHITIIQFAAWKRISKQTIYNEYSKGDYLEPYAVIKAACEAYMEGRLLDTNGNPIGAIFALKNNHEWVDKNETELSGGLTNRNELTPEAAAILAKASRANDALTDTPNPD